jgi:C4-dicarboxylate-binding protein DctP
LYGDKDEVENLIANNVQFICPDMSKLTRYDPRYDIPSMPFLFSSTQAVFDFWDKGKGQEVLKGLESEGIIGLKCWPNGFKNITNNVRLIKKPEDLEGLKIRTQSGEVLSAIYETLGASPMSIAFGELFTALQQGVTDGQSNTFSNIYTKKLDEVQKYMSVTQHNRVDYLLLTNKRFMDSLNEKTKKLVMEAVDVATEKERELSISLNQEAYKKLKERGQMEIYELTEEDRKDFKRALQPVYGKYGPKIGEEIIKDAMSR